MHGLNEDLSPEVPRPAQVQDGVTGKGGQNPAPDLTGLETSLHSSNARGSRELCYPRCDRSSK